MLQLAPRMKEKRLPPPVVGAGRLLYSQKSDQPPSQTQNLTVGSGSCLASTNGEEQGRLFLPTARSRLDVTPPRGTAHPQPQGSWWAHPTGQLCEGELLKQGLQVSKHFGG